MTALVRNEKLEIVEKVRLQQEEHLRAIQIRNLCKAYEKKSCNENKKYFVDLKK